MEFLVRRRIFVVCIRVCIRAYVNVDLAYNQDIKAIEN